MTNRITAAVWLGMGCLAGLAAGAEPKFPDFDRRAAAGEELRVVFFGASLTWGANATDQALTSYRARLAEMLEARYPRARFKCFDAAIGGTGSQLGVFRLDRDVLSRKPDLVFMDFSANDDNWNGSPENFASYESLLRRILRDAGAPVVAVMFPFKWEVGPGLKSGTSDHLKGLVRRKEIAAAYGVPVGDAAALIIRQIADGKAAENAIWDTDGVHPGDLGYRLFAEAAFDGFVAGVTNKAVCAAPEKMLGDDLFMTQRRVRLTELFPTNALPAGWRPGKPNLTAGCHDQVMSRWLDSELVAANRAKVRNAEGKDEIVPVKPERLAFRVKARYVMVFGEATTKSGKYRVLIDGTPHQYPVGKDKTLTELYDMTAKRFGANWSYHQKIVSDLDPAVEHRIEIEPVLDDAEEQELRIESVCVAGGEASVQRAEEPPEAGKAARP